MKHPEILSVLNSLLPEVVRSGDAEGVLLKRAMEDDLSPAQLERLCQTFNTAKTLVVLEKYASDRGRSFALIDAGKVLSRYAELRKEAGSLAPKAASPKRVSFFDSIPAMQWSVESDTAQVVMPKAASASDGTISRLELLMERRANQAEIDDVKLSAEFLLEIGFNAAEICGEKIATFVRDNFSSAFGDGAAFARIEEDFMCLAQGDQTAKKAFIDAVAANSNEALMIEQVKRASKIVDRAFAFDRTGQAAILVSAWDELQMQPAAGQLYREKIASMAALEKRAAFLTEAMNMQAKEEPQELGEVVPEVGGGQNQDGAPEGSRVFDFMPGKEESGDGKALADEALDALSKFRERSMALAGSVPEHYQKGLGDLTSVALGKTDAQMQAGQDKNKFRDRAAATLAELQVRDPIISKAEPALVESLASTIIQAAPSIASDRNTLMLVLREAVQYGAVPLHTLKELADIEAKLNPKPRGPGAAPQEAAT